MLVCPVCNNLSETTKSCFGCGRVLVDAGPAKDFYDPYSAYLEDDNFADRYKYFADSYCIHLYTCSYCRLKMYFKLRKMFF